MSTHELQCALVELPLIIELAYEVACEVVLKEEPQLEPIRAVSTLMWPSSPKHKTEQFTLQHTNRRHASKLRKVELFFSCRFFKILDLLCQDFKPSEG